MDNYTFDDLFKSYSYIFDEKLYEKYKQGTEKNFKEFLEKNMSDKIIHKGKDILIPKKYVDNENSLYKNLENEHSSYKNGEDYTVNDCCNRIYNHIGVPVGRMSVDVMKKQIRELLEQDEFIKEVYVKRDKEHQGRSVMCVNNEIADKIMAHSSIEKIFNNQLSKDNRAFKDEISKKEYYHETAFIECEDKMSEMFSEKDSEKIEVHLSKQEKTYELVKAIYSLLFSEFDFTSMEKDITEREQLYISRDFGERFQELDRILNQRSYEGTYYNFSPNLALMESFVDRIAEKVADKIINSYK